MDGIGIIKRLVIMQLSSAFALLVKIRETRSGIRNPTFLWNWLGNFNKAPGTNFYRKRITVIYLVISDFDKVFYDAFLIRPTKVTNYKNLEPRSTEQAKIVS